MRTLTVRNRGYGRPMSTDPDTGLVFPPEPPPDGDEVAVLLGALERQRRTFRWKCADLDDAGMHATLGPSSMTLAGLVKHLALLEDYKFGQVLHGLALGEPWDSADWDADEDWEWTSSADDSPAFLLDLWDAASARARTRVAEAIAAKGLDHPCRGKTLADGRQPTLRWLLVDFAEEYARHLGHADLIRESVDGRVGEGIAPG